MFSKKGFTLLEMLVTVGIFAVISTIILARNAVFDNEVLLNNLAYDIALSVREAQQFGINVRVAQGQFDAPYGVHFDTATSTYVAFIDNDDNGIYGGPLSGELLEVYTIGRGARIQTLCNADAGTCALTTLDIVFRRPEPDAIINNGAIGSARVELRSARQEGVRYINVSSTGQIAISKQ